MRSRNDDTLSASAALATILTVTSACCMGVRYSQIRCAFGVPVAVMVLVWSPLTTRLCAFVMRATVARAKLCGDRCMHNLKLLC